MFEIKPLVESRRAAIAEIIDQKTKPKGALGQLEILAEQLALILGSDKIKIKNPSILIFAADHGIAREGVSIAPPEVTAQMVHNFLNGGAAINCFCRANQMFLEIIDSGILSSIDHPNLVKQSQGLGTQDFSKTKAMSLDDVEQGLKLGANIARKQAEKGSNVIGFGEMGIANTSSASALMCAMTGLPIIDCVGLGTGINAKQLTHKMELIAQALNLHKGSFSDIKTTLAAVGGFEIVQMIGAMLAAAEAGCVVLVDGFICSIAAMAAIKINPLAKAYMVFCHQSEEAGHQRLLASLQVKPLLSLNLRLGEGTGAALALPLLNAAASFYNDMASFASAGVEAV